MPEIRPQDARDSPAEGKCVISRARENFQFDTFDTFFSWPLIRPGQESTGMHAFLIKLPVLSTVAGRQWRTAGPGSEAISTQRARARTLPGAVAQGSREKPQRASLQSRIDDELSKRELALDPLGYFIIKLDSSADPPMIQADYYSNTINDEGLACDDDGNVIGCGKSNSRKKVLLPRRIFRGQTAKEVSVEILESQGVGVPCEYCSHLEHANYLGRELQKAEFCLKTGKDYVQD
jgi:hypothetical protein